MCDYEQKPKGYEILASAIDEPLTQDARLNIEITLHLGLSGGEPKLHAGFRVGFTRLFVVRNVGSFVEAIERKQAITFGKGFELETDRLNLSRPDEIIISILREIESLTKGATRPPDEKTHKFYHIPPSHAPRFLRALHAREFRLALRGQVVDIARIERGKLPVRFTATGDGSGARLEARMPASTTRLTAGCEYIYSGGRVISLSAKDAKFAKALLDSETASGFVKYDIPQNTLTRFVSEMLPQLRLVGELTIVGALADKVAAGELKSSVYLDKEGIAITARVEFHYGDAVTDPFTHTQIGGGDKLFMRDALGERQIMDILSKSGFRVRSGFAYLDDADKTLMFFMEGVPQLKNHAAVYATDRFYNIRPRKPSLSGRMSIKSGYIRLTLLDSGVPTDEGLAILAALRERRRYFRLRDGAFLDLEGLESFSPLAEATAFVSESEGDEIVIGAYHAPAVFEAIEGLDIITDDSVRVYAKSFKIDMVRPPVSLNAELRAYQVRGYSWIHTLYGLSLGGVLADDMGLGKTVQTIAAILRAKEEQGAALSLVVAPTSLVYNWLSETNKFAPTLTVTVIEGTAEKRRRTWQELANGDAPDIIVTSYPLLRRDMEFMQDIHFRMVVIDEAQQIKNAKAIASTYVKSLKADARFALTGTPMENHPAELWSIFDFALPGFLGDLQGFMTRHGAGQNAGQLRKRVEPYLMRRLKKDVLPELPDKLDRTLIVDMPHEQRAIYDACLSKAKTKIERLMETQGFTSGRFEVLSIITELRQLCCHPSLKFDGYHGGSGKMDALLELLPSAIENGGRVLLFSQFTAMLAILRKTFEGQGVSCLYLDGKTPVVERLHLTERFNGGEGSLFLISLKAGGAGLNLTGADIVVHYDPWWNPAVEDQATDRAHRIGQTRAVQVIRMITRGSIEEQVNELRERKRELYDKLIPSQTPFDERDVREMFNL